MKKFFKKPIDNDLEIELNNYILEGGFPLAVKYDTILEKRNYVKSIIDEIYKKDVKKNKKIKNRHLFNQIQTYIIKDTHCDLNICIIKSDFISSNKINF